jgi:RHS repeat-associated protein
MINANMVMSVKNGRKRFHYFVFNEIAKHPRYSFGKMCQGKMRLTSASRGGITTYYAASSYVVEVNGTTTTVRKTYLAGSTSLAVRTIVNGTQNTLNWTLSDHLGSSSVTTTANGTWYSELRYSVFGETRYSSGITPTDYRYTGQLEQADVNLYYYNARWYDPELGRFIQADTIVPEPGSAKSYDRYSYVNNNPVRYTDPSGHGVPYGVCEIAGGSIPQCQKQGGSPAYMPKYAPATPKKIVNIAFGGADNGLPEQGTSAESQFVHYADSFSKSIANEFVTYPGYKEMDVYTNNDVGKSGMAFDAAKYTEKYGKGVAYDLYCWSAGAEACVMFAEDQIAQGYEIRSMYLIAGAYGGVDHNLNLIYYDEPVDNNYMDRIGNLVNNEGVNIILLTDKGEAVTSPPLDIASIDRGLLYNIDFPDLNHQEIMNNYRVENIIKFFQERVEEN